MNPFLFSMSGLLAICLTLTGQLAAAEVHKVATVNFKKCVEESKVGKQEEAAFETMKKQLETGLADREKALNELAEKLNDPDQLDLMSLETETELKRKFRAASQEFNQIQAQSYQMLQQANMQGIQRLSAALSSAAAQVAKEMGIDLILNDETSFFAAPTLDVSKQVVVQMDKQFEEEGKKAQ